MTTEHALQDDPHRRVVRIGDTVRRPVYPWTPTAHRLLRHLEAIGFPYSPRAIGYDEQGREVLSFITGESGPAGWARIVPVEGLVATARLLRAYHDAVLGFHPEGDLDWGDHIGPLLPGRLVCHGDFGPWNLVWVAGRPVGILDWDHVHPGHALDDVAYALEYAVPFRDDQDSVRWMRHPSPPDRRRRLHLFAWAYGLPSTDGLVDAVIARQQAALNRVERLAARGQQPHADWVAAGHLDLLAAHIAWSRAHRHLVE